MWVGIIFVAVVLVFAVLAVVEGSGNRPRLRHGDKPTRSSTLGRGWKRI